jgi:hypothetical protein
MSAVEDTSRISRYLLHEADEREQEEIERRYLTDPEYLALLDAVEGDLIDAYVRRELSHAQRARFEKYFLCTRARRERLQMAEALQQNLRPERKAWPRAALAIAASLLVILGLGAAWLFLATRNPQPATPQVIPQRAETPKPPVTIAVTLLPGLTRDSALPQKIVLRPDVEQVRVNALVELDGDWRDLRASLGTWTASNLTLNADRTVTIAIPAAQLAPGEHVLVLTSGGEPLGDYAFVVEKKIQAPL